MHRPFGPLVATAWLALALGASFAACSSEESPGASANALADGCAINSDCSTPLVCAFRRCHTACESTRDCPEGERCMASDRPFHVCQLPIEQKCAYNSDCPTGQVCGVDGQCRDACAADRDCVGGQLCTQGTCAEVPELVGGRLPTTSDASADASGQPCSYTSECASPFVCRSGLCAFECAADADCAAGSSCVGHVCTMTICGGQDPGVAGGQTCQYNSMCPSPLVCRGGRCDCQCIADRDCPAGLSCASFRCGTGSTSDGGKDASAGDGSAKDAGAGTFEEFPLPKTDGGFGATPTRMIAGPGGDLWFLDPASAAVGKITTGGAVTMFPWRPGTGSTDLALGPDGNVWVSDSTGYLEQFTPQGARTDFVTFQSASPAGITAGPNGHLWYTDVFYYAINEVDTAGNHVNAFPVPMPEAGIPSLLAITTGPDGNLWFTDSTNGLIGRMTPTGTVTLFPIPTLGASVYRIASGPDGNLWFTENNQCGKVTPAGVFTEYLNPHNVGDVTAGPDGNLWFTTSFNNALAIMTPQGVDTEIAVPTPAAGLIGIAAGSDGRLWFAESAAGKIGAYQP